ncbi:MULTISPECIES: glycosyltransferase family 2 protein [unclassified Thiocapsa]|uniref:glycosyltransferase family 2 protein n=1 Tax=unclassified Thiocapsa TaxID=2641286 RepID=UPI0035B31468
MKFTIITVCRNSEKTIRRTIESVLSQSFMDYEYLIVDGASTDHTLDIIKEYSSAFDGRLHWWSAPDKGIYDAMNKGLEMARGDYIGILNSDDFYEPGAFGCVNASLEQQPVADVVYGITRYLSADGDEMFLARGGHRFIVEQAPNHESAFISRHAYEKCGFYDLNYSLTADYDHMLRMKKSGMTFRALDEIVLNFVIGGSSSVYRARWQEELLRIRFRHGYISRLSYWKATLRYRIKTLLV